MSQSTPSRLRVNSTRPTNNGSTPPPANSSQKGRAKSLPPDVKKDSKVRRSLMVNKAKSGDAMVGSQKGKENEDLRLVVVGRSLNRQPVVEQFARPRRVRPVSAVDRKSEEDTTVKNELKDKLELSEGLVKDLQAQVLALKEELDRAHVLNEELESQNKTLLEDLAASEAKVAALSNCEQESNGDYQSPKFKDIQKLIANKLEHSIVRKDIINVTCSSIRAPRSPPPPPPPSALRSPSKAAEGGEGEAPSKAAEGGEGEAPSCSSLPLPPPPPPPLHPLARTVTSPKTPAIVEFYHSLRKQEEKRNSPGPGNQYKPSAMSAHSSIVGEIQNRSSHQLAIKADVETKRDLINDLIQKVLTAAYTDIEDVLNFVDWLDGELSSLADERAVLKHFKWPEKKADAIREAAIEYRGLKLLETEISSYKDDENIPCGTALKKMAVLLEKSEQSIQRLIKLRGSVIRSYQDWRIPTNWMLDTGIVRKIKQASMNLARMYMKRVVREIDLARKSDRESNQEALLLQGVHFAYKAHQFAGGLDSETMCTLEEIRQRVPGHLGGSQELLAAIPMAS